MKSSATPGLTTWELSGPRLPQVAQTLRTSPGVEQVVAFGNTLHVSGRDARQLEAALAPWMQAPYRCRRIDSGLEDVFISLMQTAPDNFS